MVCVWGGGGGGNPAPPNTKIRSRAHRYCAHTCGPEHVRHATNPRGVEDCMGPVKGRHADTKGGGVEGGRRQQKSKYREQ